MKPMKTAVELYNEWKSRPVLFQEDFTHIETAIAYGFGEGVKAARGEPVGFEQPMTKADDKMLGQELANQIYAAYPRKQGRGAAMKAIHKAMKTVTGLELLEATSAYAKAVATWGVDDKAFVPHPATWFNQERYADDRALWKRVSPGQQGPQIRGF